MLTASGHRCGSSFATACRQEGVLQRPIRPSVALLSCCSGRRRRCAESKAGTTARHPHAAARPPGEADTREAQATGGGGTAEQVPHELRDVRRILEDMRRSILHGCVITFSGVRPLPPRAHLRRRNRLRANCT